MSKMPSKVKMVKSSEKYNIICFSNQLWDFPNWTNKRHVMSRLAKQGHNVVFVDPPINLGKVYFKQIQRGYWDVSRVVTQTKKDESGALIYTPVNLVPINSVTSKLHVNRLQSLAKAQFDPTLKTLIWVYHVQLPLLANYIDGLNHDVLIYDCVDNYDAFPAEKAFYKTSVYAEDLVAQEKSLAERANIVFASAPGLVDKMKQYSSNVHYTPNVGDYEAFHNTKSLKGNLPEYLKNIPRPRIGYIGALDDYKFDYALVEKLAREHPKYNFVIIGPLALKDKNAKLEDLPLAKYPNVFLPGSVPYEKKKYYMAGFDVDIIPYVLNDYTVGGCFPVKFHDSLAAGLPVVVTDLPAYAPFNNVCYISKTYEEFSTNIKKALDEDSLGRIKARQEVAKENNWDGKVEKMLTLIASL